VCYFGPDELLRTRACCAVMAEDALTFEEFVR
jgi:hypothetical protein